MQARTANVILIANVESNSVSLLDEDTQQLLAEIPVGVNPHEVLVTPNNKYALVSNYGDIKGKKPGSTLTIIDIENQSVYATIDLPPACRPHGLKCLSDNEVLVTAQGIQSLLIVDYMQGTIKSRIRLPGSGAHMVTTDKAKQYAYVGNMDSGTVCKVDLEFNVVVKQTSVGKSAESVLLTLDEKNLLVTNGKDNYVAVLKTDDFAIIKQIPTGYMPVRVALCHQGKSAIVTNSVSGTAEIIDLATFKVTRKINTTNTYSHRKGSFLGGLFGVLPVPITVHVRDDQKTAYITNFFAGKVSLVDLDNGKLLKAFEAGKGPDGLDVSHLLRRN